MQRFLMLLKESKSTCVPPAELVSLAVRLCQDLHDDLANAEPLVEAVLRSPRRLFLLDCEDVVLVCVLVLAQKEQYQVACRLLEDCRVPGGSLELVEAWNDIHYRMTMRRLGVATLSPLQSFRCRKRNHPPLRLCPEALGIRNFPRDVQQKLQNFASGVSTYPNKAQREMLSLETNLSEKQVYNWFGNYRKRRTKAPRQHRKLDTGTITENREVSQRGPDPPHPSEDIHADPECVDRSQCLGPEETEETGLPWPSGANQGPWAPMAPALAFPRDGTLPMPPAPRMLQNGEMYQEGTGQGATAFTNICPGPDFSLLTADNNTVDPSQDDSGSWLMSLALVASREACFQDVHPVHSQELGFTMPYPGAAIAGTSGSTAALDSKDNSLKFQATTWEKGFTDTVSRTPQSFYLEKGPGNSGGHMEMQAESFLATQPLVLPPEFILPQSQGPVQATSSSYHPVPSMELSQSFPSSQVQWPSGQGSNDAYWGAQMSFEFSRGSLASAVPQKMASTSGGADVDGLAVQHNKL